jgi:hypothetical protein
VRRPCARRARLVSSDLSVFRSVCFRIFSSHPAARSVFVRSVFVIALSDLDIRSRGFQILCILCRSWPLHLPPRHASRLRYLVFEIAKRPDCVFTNLCAGSVLLSPLRPRPGRAPLFAPPFPLPSHRRHLPRLADRLCFSVLLLRRRCSLSSTYVVPLFNPPPSSIRPPRSPCHVV